MGGEVHDSKMVLAFQYSKLAHQIQISILEIIRGGWADSASPLILGVLLPNNSRPLRVLVQKADA